MNEGRDDSRWLVVDASVFKKLAGIDLVDALAAVDGTVVIPGAVADEITDEPASSVLETAEDDEWVATIDVTSRLVDAAGYLGSDLVEDDVSGAGHRQVEGDVAILALALRRKEATGKGTTVVVSDDKPLRETCKALSIPVSGSIGIVVRTVENGTSTPAEAKDKLYAMDEIGARLSASLVRKAEQLIDRAADD